jgi:hypothetical protein
LPSKPSTRHASSWVAQAEALFSALWKVTSPVAVLESGACKVAWGVRTQVIRNAQSARVTLWNNETYEASLQGVEPDKDLAVLKIKNLPPAAMRPVSVGSSSGLQVCPASSHFMCVP